MNGLWKMRFIISVISRWLVSYLKFNSKKSDPLHVIFCLVDHFEPGTGNVTMEIEEGRMAELLSKYPRIAEKHQDYFGNMPTRTWFFPPHYHRNNNLKKLVSICEKGYGEIELHLHHGKHKPDTSDNLKHTIQQCIQEYGEFGIFGSQNGEKKYGFIHGDWALDNSRKGKYCGVNDELDILCSTGCYADFTFPSLCESNPKQINSIYYAIEDSTKPKSYNSGIPVKKGCINSDGGLMIIQGPLHPFFISKKPTSLRALGDAINGRLPVTEKRVDFWIKTRIHIKENSNWLIVKTHTHGATDSKAVLGNEMERIFEHLESNYNDGKQYMLHYVTARELYNIIKAAEAGEIDTNPEVYRDYLVDKPSYNSSLDIAEASDKLKTLVARTYYG